jgi:lauroyl/myristoyl acyltransferase
MLMTLPSSDTAPVDVPPAPADAPGVLKVRGREKWVSHGLSNAFMYKTIAFGCERFPLPLLRAISIVGNSIGIAFLGKTVAEIAENYRLAFGAGEKESHRLARRLFYSYGLNTVDLFRLRAGGEALAPPITTFEKDAAALAGVRGAGRGFLIVSAHVGNWEMGAISLLRHRIPAAFVGQPELDPEVHAVRLRIRARLGVESITIGDTMTTALRVREAVERGLAVALVADRAYADDSIDVPFFGRPTPFLRSPALLARFCGCPILPGFFLRNAEGTYRSLFGEPIHADPALAPEDDARRMMTAVAAAVERAVREEPLQWFNFYSFWSGSGPRNRASGDQQAKNTASRGSSDSPHLR